MIPKPGDIVDLNPLFKKASIDSEKDYCDEDETIEFSEEEDGHIHVAGVTNHYRNTLKIILNNYCVYIINLDGTVPKDSGDGVVFDYGFPVDAQLFVPIMQCVKKIFDLKAENTKVGVINCAACGGLLKDPGMGPKYKYCPKCEP
jgi:hypothetical protein